MIREDPNKRGLLYAGTETGIYVSFDNGARWQSLQLNLPVVPITDLAVHKREKELVVATQGRSFWIFDDLPLLHQVMDAGGFKAFEELHLFKSKEPYRMPGAGGPNLPATATVGRNPASGAVIYYSLKAKPVTDVVLELVDANGNSVRKFTAKAPRVQPSSTGGAAASTGEQASAPGGEEADFFGGGPPARLTTDVGLNRFVWDLRYADAVRFPGMILWAGETRGPHVVPGIYRVKLTVDGQTLQDSFEVKADPRLRTTAAEYAKQLELTLKIRDKLSETHNAIIQIRDVRKQVDDLLKRIKDQPNASSIIDVGATLNKNLTSIEEALYQTKNQSSQDPLNFPVRLNNKLAALGGVVGRSETPPTDQAYAVYDVLVVQIDAELQKLAGIMKSDVPAFNKLVSNQNIPAVIVKPQSQAVISSVFGKIGSFARANRGLCSSTSVTLLNTA